MELKAKSMGALCELEEFIINGIKAEYDNFGDKDDIESGYTEPYCCGNMKFTAKPATSEILEKYKITVDEYNKVCDKLDEELSFGSCGLCS